MLRARLAAREERIDLLEEENRWLKSQLFERSSEKTPAEEISPEQAWLFNEAEALARAAESAPQSIAIPAYERGKGGRKKLSASLPRVDVVHDLPEDQKRCTADGTALERIGEEVSEQLDFKPASVRVIRNIRPKYACPCCKSGVRIAPVPVQLLPKSLATPALLAHITTAKFVDGIPLYRQESQFDRLGVPLGRATIAGWMIQLGGTHVVPVVNLLRDYLLEAPLIHCDETRLQVLKSDKAPTADHWMWVRAGGPPGRKIILFDYDPSRAGAVPLRLFEDYHGILLTDGYEPYERRRTSAEAHARRLHGARAAVLRGSPQGTVRGQRHARSCPSSPGFHPRALPRGASSLGSRPSSQPRASSARARRALSPDRKAVPRLARGGRA